MPHDQQKMTGKPVRQEAHGFGKDVADMDRRPDIELGHARIIRIGGRFSYSGPYWSL